MHARAVGSYPAFFFRVIFEVINHHLRCEGTLDSVDDGDFILWGDTQLTKKPSVLVEHDIAHEDIGPNRSNISRHRPTRKN